MPDVSEKGEKFHFIWLSLPFSAPIDDAYDER